MAMDVDFQGQLLVAHPLLNDGFFNRSVVLLTNHGSEGAVGFSLNLKTNLLLRDIRPQIKHGNFPIYEGGPVARQQLFFLHTLGHDLADAFHVQGNIFMGGDFDELLHLIDHGKVKSYEVKFFAGYSGWEATQLENEIRRNNWFVHKPKDALFFFEEIDKLWGSSLSAIKSTYSIFSDFAFDPSNN